MSDPSGADSPSPIGPLLIWQQPHPIFFAELCLPRAIRTMRRSNASRTSCRATAEFMAAYAWFNDKTGRYDLGPPVIPAQEKSPGARDVEPHIRAGVLAVRTANRTRMAAANEARPGAAVGQGHRTARAAADERRRLPRA
jgi:hypothetical protein